MTYKQTIKKEFPARNEMALPAVDKIVVNIGLGKMSQQAHFEDKILPEIIETLALITGQKPSPTRARKSIAGFKVRAGQIVGLKTTLRHKRMHDFLARFVGVTLPRVRDFRGIDLKNIDKGGHLSIGLRDISVFPEVNSETMKVDFGLEVSIVSTAKSRDEAIKMYRALGVPLKK